LKIKKEQIQLTVSEK